MSGRRHLHLVENWPSEDLRVLDLLLAGFFILGLIIGAAAMWAVMA